MILEISKRVDPTCPENSLNKTEPTKHFVHPFFTDKLNHLVEHAVAMFETVHFFVKQLAIGIIDLADTPLDEKLAVGLDDFDNFFRCHFVPSIFS